MERLQFFLPRAGGQYAANRNYDWGPDDRSNISMLSPWIRTRLLPEWEVARQVLEIHSYPAASKFIEEVCWRTYWKGWLLSRPVIWREYLDDLDTLIPEFQNQESYLGAISGENDIPCFDAWSRELITTGYLHNHARMWYASIWIHTLKLPWQLGADFFMRHLLDGDPASNTLSWRWVAGLHTKGKSYLAHSDNISKYTAERFPKTDSLAKEAVWNDQSTNHPDPIELTPQPAVPEQERLGLIVTDEDLASLNWIPKKHSVMAVAGLFPLKEYHQHNTSEAVIHFRKACMESELNKSDASPLFLNSNDLICWAEQQQLTGLLISDPMTGFWDSLIDQIQRDLTDKNIRLYRLRHDWDNALLPHATKGFFKFKKAIPDALALVTSID